MAISSSRSKEASFTTGTLCVVRVDISSKQVRPVPYQASRDRPESSTDEPRTDTVEIVFILRYMIDVHMDHGVVVSSRGLGLILFSKMFFDEVK